MYFVNIDCTDEAARVLIIPNIIYNGNNGSTIRIEGQTRKNYKCNIRIKLNADNRDQWIFD